MLHYPQFTFQSHYVPEQTPVHLQHKLCLSPPPVQYSWNTTTNSIVHKWWTKACELRRKRGVVRYPTPTKAPARSTSRCASVHATSAGAFETESHAIEKRSGTGASTCLLSVLCQTPSTSKVDIELALKLTHFDGFDRRQLSDLEQNLRLLVESMATKKLASAASKSRKHQSDKDSEASQTPEQYIAARKKEAVEAVMSVFNKWLDKRLSVISYAYECADGSGNPRGGSGDWTSDEGRSGSGSSRGRPKRHFNDDDDQSGSSAGGDGGGDGGDRNGNKRARKTAEEKLLFACPFFQQDPTQHCTQRSCTGPGWPSIHRLKEHLTRRHLLPKHTCPRCREPMADALALEGHLRSDVPCVKRDVVRMLGIDEAQEKKLKERKKTSGSLTEEHKWKDIYMILFPRSNKNALPSPYYDSRHPVTIAKSAAQWKKFKKHIHDELPQAVQKRVEQRFDGVKVELLHGLSDIIQDEIFQIFKGFPQGGASTPISPGPDSRSTTPKLTNVALPGDESRATSIDDFLMDPCAPDSLFFGGLNDLNFNLQFDPSTECLSDSGYASNGTNTALGRGGYTWP
ncbi:hypothetical protein BKA67DRAFT_552823 [Truncatella angustata]|uniref:Uncharacterized protein n=1 Tax=Truncatella angustata TaxID=152316 RepID=A0A9P8UQW7_9PEZI|nr:uncharacterized protein BKA67DRAFT_552823 [Truncatella angustata]KAH6656714.1 hypothetical protein BKA67DRAFT_552823 [Truncatella angustata]KAH8198660.1 hypothetical protein TruAng_007158 [Truncatella angustata]